MIDQLYPEWVSACARIVKAAGAGKGVRLSAEEVRQAAQDVSNWETVQEELGEIAAQPGTSVQRCAECDCEHGGADCSWIAPKEPNDG